MHFLGLLGKLLRRRSCATHSALLHARSWMEIQRRLLTLNKGSEKHEGMGCHSVCLLVLCDDARELAGAQQGKKVFQLPNFFVHELRQNFRPQTSETRKHDRPIKPTENSVAKVHRETTLVSSSLR